MSQTDETIILPVIDKRYLLNTRIVFSIISQQSIS